MVNIILIFILLTQRGNGCSMVWTCDVMCVPRSSELCFHILVMASIPIHLSISGENEKKIQIKRKPSWGLCDQCVLWMVCVMSRIPWTWPSRVQRFYRYINPFYKSIYQLFTVFMHMFSVSLNELLWLIGNNDTDSQTNQLLLIIVLLHLFVFP